MFFASSSSSSFTRPQLASCRRQGHRCEEPRGSRPAHQGTGTGRRLGSPHRRWAGVMSARRAEASLRAQRWPETSDARPLAGAIAGYRPVGCRQ